MRIIPVMDLKAGFAVHAVRGERAAYRPVSGALVSDGNPQALARAFHERLGLQELYIADLDAIQGRGMQQVLIAALVGQPGQTLMVDAGTATVAEAQQVLALGAQRVVIGTETLAGDDELAAIFHVLPPDRLVFSLDLNGGRVLAKGAQLDGADPLELLTRVYAYGCQEAILLDLARVGAATGVDLALLAKVHSGLPGLRLLAGGGVRHVADLQDLAAAGAAGALVATALHNAIITRTEIANLAGQA